MTMKDAWFWNHVLALCLSMVALCAPGPLGAWTPNNQSSDPTTTDFYSSASAQEDAYSEAASLYSESPSTSQGHRLQPLRSTAGHRDAAETQTFTERSSSSLESTSLTTEPLSSSVSSSTTEAIYSSSSTHSSDGTGGTHSGDRTGGTHSSSSSTHSSDRTGGNHSSSSTHSSDGTGGTHSSSSTHSSDGTGGNHSSSSTHSSDGTGDTHSSRTLSSSSTHSSDGTGGTHSGDRTGGTHSSSSTHSSDGTGGTHSSRSSTHSSDRTGGTHSSSSTQSSNRAGGTHSSSSTHSSDGTGGTHSSSSTHSSDGTGGTHSSSSTHSSDGTDGTHSSEGTGSTHRDQAHVGSPAVSWEPRVWTWTETEDLGLLRDSPDSTLRLGDVTDFISQTAMNTDSAYTSTTMSRAGERTLLSVTSFQNNSTSSVFTEDSLSSLPSATWALSLQTVGTEDYTHTISVPKTEVMDSNHQTDTSRETYSEMGHPVTSTGIETLTNFTENQQSFTSEVTSNLTPSVAVTEHSIDQTEFVVSSTPPMFSPAILPTNISPTNQEVSSYYETPTQVSTEVQSLSTQKQEGTEGVPSRTEEDKVDFSLTTAPPTVSSRTDDALTEMPPLVTDVFRTTTTVTVTERSQLQEEATSHSTVSTTSAPQSHTSTSKHTTTSLTTPPSQTEATVSHTILSTKAYTPEQQTTTAYPTPRAVTSNTPKPSTNAPTKGTTLQLETSTRARDATTAAYRRMITTASTNGTPTQSAETQTMSRRAGGEKTTTAPAIQPPPPPPRNPCVSNPCMNGGMCVNYVGHQFTCHCQQAWTGPTCNEDVNECERDPCPVGSRCVNTRGSFSCECPLGFDLEDGRTCTRAKTFLGTFSVKRQPHDPLIFKSATMHEIQREIIQLLNASLSVLRGYSRSTLSKKEEGGVHIFAVNMFSISADVTSSEVYNSIQMSLTNCSSSVAHCRMVLHHQLTYHVESLCVAQQTQCDTERSTCTDISGTASCQCLQGYYKHNPEDLSCLECGDGYKLENGTCVPCVFGFGGFNCGNFYKLIAVVVSPAGGGILLILIIALIVTCFKRDKNDINKIIFKSGDLQMSPYADFPKTNRISMEWGRETIEMQENGSTKNLLQMTDIYYSPALRNADLERNGLHPFTGLPGSRHSCIYPAQWNPSFISDDSRRRDYF